MRSVTAITIRPIHSLACEHVSHLVNESKSEGFRFLERLVKDYTSGDNTFNKMGERLYGAYDSAGKMIAVGGINQDPYSKRASAGRLRRFYVLKDERRRGIGRRLAKKILSEAGRHFSVVVLKTDSPQADRFYRSLGFQKGDRFPYSTHFYIFK